VSGCKSVESNMVDSGQDLEAKSHLSHVNAHMTDNLEWIEAHNVYEFDGFFQGDTPIEDELDFYHVAGDKRSEAKVVEWRKKYNLEIMTSWSATGAGAALILGGLGLMSYRTGFDFNKIDTESKDPVNQIGLGVAIAGGVVVGLGYFVGSFFAPDKNLNEWELVLDPSEAGEAAAAAHNEKKASSSSSSSPSDAAPSDATPSDSP
jgi:hypothetical protein